MQWREPPERVDQLHGDIVEFGRGRARGRGYLAHSNRVGPGVLLLDPAGQKRADALNAEGFTVLVPEVPYQAESGAVFDAAAEYLSANWHPRLGVVAFGSDGALAAASVARGPAAIDVLVLYEALWDEHGLPPVPVVGHFSEEVDRAAIDRFFGTATVPEDDVELHIYEGARRGFYEPRADSDGEASALALARTLDALEYYLS